MWFLRVFNRSDDELTAEARLSETAVLDVGAQAGVVPSPYVSTEIPADVAAAVTASSDLPIDEATFVYLLEFDDDEPERPASRPEHRQHADR
jgi:hypothetical protein